MLTFELSELSEAQWDAGRLYHEFLRVPAMSMGLYVLPAGADDPQRPHAEDEVYYVTRGRGMLRVGDEDRAVSEGSIVYVAAGADHRFHSIEKELSVLVYFAPAESVDG